MKTRIVLLFCLCMAAMLPAQQDFVSVPVQNGQLRSYFSNFGLPNNLFTNGPLMTYYDEEQEEYKPLVTAANLWITSLDIGGGIRFYGPTYGAYSSNSQGVLVKVYQINIADIRAHKTDFEDNGVIDQPIDAIYEWPGKGNPHFEAYNPNMSLPGDTSSLAPFWDANGDAIYNPDDGDYPILKITGCSESEQIQIIPTQMNWCIYDIKASFTEEVLYRVQANMFYFDCEVDSYLSNTLFTQHEVFNISDALHFDAYWGLWLDPDLGNPNDDYVGSFPERLAAFVYNADNLDEDDDEDERYSGFGENPPVFGADILRGPNGFDGVPAPFSAIMPYYSGSILDFPPQTMDPSLISTFYGFLQGNWADNTSLSVGGIGYQQEEPTGFAFPGLPEQGGWTEWQEQNPMGNRKLVMGYGPFEYGQGNYSSVISAFTYYDGPGDHLSKVEGLRGQFDQVQNFYDNCLQPAAVGLPDCNLITTSTKSTPSLIDEIEVFPNPTNGSIQIRSPYLVQELRLINSQGAEIRRFQGHTSNVFRLPSNLPKGIYYLEIDINGKKRYKKILLQ